MRRLLFVFITFLHFTISSLAQIPISNHPIVARGSVQEKNFYLLTLLQNDPKISGLINKDPLLCNIALKQKQAIATSLNAFNYKEITTNLKLSTEQIDQAGVELSKIYSKNKYFQDLVRYKLIPSKAYIHYKNLKPEEQLIKAWQQDAEDINHIIAVYAEGDKPNYPDIDSISFSVRSEDYIKVVKKAAQQIINKSAPSNLFFAPAMMAALTFLNINNRNDAGIYEPMENTVNKAPLQRP